MNFCVEALEFNGSVEHPRAPEVAAERLAERRADYTVAADALALAERLFGEREVHEARERLDSAKAALGDADKFFIAANSPTSRKAQAAYLRTLEREHTEREEAAVQNSARRAAATARASAIFVDALEICRTNGSLPSALAGAIQTHFRSRGILPRDGADIIIGAIQDGMMKHRS